MPDRHFRPTPTRGFTIIEMLIVLVIAAILAAVAYPSFQRAVQKSRRADAIAALTTVMQAQERWRSNHYTYKGSVDGLYAVTAVSSDGHYDISIAKATANDYSALATARSTSPQYSDSVCRVLMVNSTDGILSYGSQYAAADAAGNPSPKDNTDSVSKQCWNK